MWSPVNSFVNSCFNRLFDALCWPIAGLPDLWQAGLLGLPAALFALLVFRYVSDQRALATAKARTQAYLLELWLYRDDLRVMLGAQGRLLRQNLLYLRAVLAPMAVMMVPFLLMLAQLEARFAYRSLAPGDSTLLTLTLDGAEALETIGLELELPDGIVQETPALRIPSLRQIAWRLGARAKGDYEVGIRLGGVRLVHSIRVDGTAAGVAPLAYRAGDWNALAYPGQPPIAEGGPVREVHLDYPRNGAALAGLSPASWVFFVSSLLFGFALRGPFGVTF